jgi:hypothetical protein
VLFEHMVLDGRHRLRACEETGTAPRFEEYNGDKPAAHVLSLNLHRRHLSVSQRAMIVTAFLPALEIEARGRMSAAGASASPGQPKVSPSADTFGDRRSGLSSAHAGRIAGVGPETVQRAKRIAEADSDLAEQVRSGTLTVNGALAELGAAAAQGGKRKRQGETQGENGRNASGRSIQRIAASAAALGMALDAIPLHKSCARLTDDERTEALQHCKKGLKALNALANALGR